MKKYKVYTARLEYNRSNKFVAEIEAENIKQIDNILKKEYNLNPYYAVIIDDSGKIVYNNFLSLYIK